MGLITEEQLQTIKEIAEKRIREIREFTPLLNFELKSLNEIQFIQKVCKGEFDFINAKEGEYMFRCSFGNKRYFHRLNSGKKELLDYTKEVHLIEVEIAGLARFEISCPHAGNRICLLRNFSYATKKEAFQGAVQDEIGRRRKND